MNIYKLYCKNTKMDPYKEVCQYIDRKNYKYAIVLIFKQRKLLNREGTYVAFVLRILKYICDACNQNAFEAFLTDQESILPYDIIDISYHTKKLKGNIFFMTQIYMLYIDNKFKDDMISYLKYRCSSGMYSLLPPNFMNTNRKALFNRCVKKKQRGQWNHNAAYILLELLKHNLTSHFDNALVDVLSNFSLSDFQKHELDNFIDKHKNYISYKTFALFIAKYKEEVDSKNFGKDHEKYDHVELYMIEEAEYPIHPISEDKYKRYISSRARINLNAFNKCILIQKTRKNKNTQTPEFWEMFDHNLLYPIKEFIF